MNKKLESQIKTNTDSQSIPEVYTNSVFINMTPYEFEITLGLGSSNYEGTRPVSNVRMSPEFAKEFLQLLQNNVKIFEEKFGEIPSFQQSRSN